MSFPRDLHPGLIIPSGWVGEGQPLREAKRRGF